MKVWCEIVCSQCARSTAGHFTGRRIAFRPMIKMAKQQGWVLLNSEWHCQECKKDTPFT